MKATSELTAAEWAYQHGRGTGEYLCEMATTIGLTVSLVDSLNLFLETFDDQEPRRKPTPKFRSRTIDLRAKLKRVEERLLYHNSPRSRSS